MINNALAYAQFQIRGGWKSAAWFAGSYAVLVTTAYLFATTMAPRGVGMPAGWLSMLTGVQTMALLLFGSSRIAMGIRNDLTSRMIESHRLMPTAPSQAILGYMVGGAAHALLVTGVTFVIGAMICATRGLAAHRWILSNAILILFAAFIWTAIALSSFASSKGKGGVVWLFVIMGTGFSSQGAALAIAPALMVLCSPILGNTIFINTGGGAAPSTLYAVSLGGQVIIGALCFHAAARRYRSAEARGFTSLMGLALLATFATLSIYAMQNWLSIRPGLLGRRTGTTDDFRIAQGIVSTAVAMLLSILPLSAASHEKRRYDLAKHMADPAAGRRAISPIFFALVCALVTFCIALSSSTAIPAQGEEFLLHRAGVVKPQTAAIIIMATMLLAFMTTMLHLVRILHRGGGRYGKWLMVLVIFAVFVGPFIAEWIRFISTDMVGPPLSSISGVSPPGTMIHVFGEGGADPTPGVIAQALVATAMVGLFYLTGRKRRV